MDKLQRPSIMNPDMIVSKLFYYHNCAHFYHLQTTQFSTHKNLDKLYKELVDHKDSIAEFLLGVQIPKRFGTLNTEQVMPYSEQNVIKLIDDGIAFSKQLCTYAEANEWEELCNLSSNLQGSFVRAKLFTTYK